MGHQYRATMAGIAFGTLVAIAVFGGMTPVSAQTIPVTTSARLSQPPSDATDEVLVAQRMLHALGYSVGAINGELNDETQEAIRSFQRQNLLRVDGRVSMSLMTFLAAHTVDLIPEGDSEEILGISDVSDVAFRFEDRNVISLVQRVLTRHGFEPGRIDGVMEPATRRAIANFQSQMGMPVTGEIDDALLSTLGEFVTVNRDFRNTDR